MEQEKFIPPEAVGQNETSTEQGDWERKAVEAKESFVSAMLQEGGANPELENALIQELEEIARDAINQEFEKRGYATMEQGQVREVLKVQFNDRAIHSAKEWEDRASRNKSEYDKNAWERLWRDKAEIIYNRAMNSERERRLRDLEK